MTLTTEDLCREFGVAASSVRSWVERGWIEPVRRGARPLRFREDDVAVFRRERLPEQERERLRRLAEAWRLTSADMPCDDSA